MSKAEKTTDHQPMQFRQVYDKFKNHLVGFELKRVFEVYLPFWKCTQQIIVEKELSPDRFSEIILRLVQNGIVRHSALCGFLGINGNSFALSQVHFLVKNGLLLERAETDDVGYTITSEGRAFMNGKLPIKNLQEVEFEYYYNDLGSCIVNPALLLDQDKRSNGDKRKFSGYKLLETRRLSEDVIKIPHENRPNKIDTVTFSKFFESGQSGDSFYDFKDSPETHKRSVCFLALEFEDSFGSKRYEVRHSRKSVTDFHGFQLEDELSKLVTAFWGKRPVQK